MFEEVEQGRGRKVKKTVMTVSSENCDTIGMIGSGLAMNSLSLSLSFKLSQHSETKMT